MTIFIALVAIVIKDRRKQAITYILISGTLASTIMYFKSTLKAYSYNGLISANEALLERANDILRDKRGNVIYSTHMITSNSSFSKEEISVLNSVIDGLNARFIRKDSSSIYYCTDGVMGSDYGIWYFYTENKPKGFLQIKDRWYYE